MEETPIDARIGSSSLHRERAWNWEGRARLGIWSSENGIKVEVRMEDRKVMDTQ